MNVNWKANFLFDSRNHNRPDITYLTVWEADVEEIEIEAGNETTHRKSFLFVSEDNDLSPDLFEFAKKAIDLKLQKERIMKMALETVPLGNTGAGSTPQQRIVGLRALFEAETLPFIQHSEDKELEPDNRIFPADHYADSEKWAKLATDDRYRPTSQMSSQPDLHDTALKQGAFAELFKNAAYRTLNELCKLNDLHDNIAFFEDQTGLTLEVTYCPSNADPVEAACILRVPMSEAQGIMVDRLVSAQQVGQSPSKSIDELIASQMHAGTLPKEIHQALVAVEKIIYDWATSPEQRTQTSVDPTKYFSEQPPK